MKINIKRQDVYIALLFAAVISGCIIRIVQFTSTIEESTGFYKTDSPSIIIINVFSVLVYLMFLSCFLFFKNTKNTDGTKILNMSSKRPIINLALVSLFVSKVIFIIMNNGKNIDSNLMAELALSLFFAFYLFMTMSYGKTIRQGKGYELMAIAPIIYSIYMLANTFIKYTSIANISERMFEIIMLCFLVLFFTSYSKFATGRSSEKPVFVWGLCAAFSTAMYVVPSLVLFKSLDENAFNFIINHLIELFICLYVLVITIKIRKGLVGRKFTFFKTKPEETPAE